MSEQVLTGRAATLLAGLHTLTDELLTLDLGVDTDAELTAAYVELERLRRRLPAVEHRFVHDTQRRGLPLGCKTTGQFLAGLLHIDPAEAHARVRAADNLHGRVALSGEPLPAPFAHVAAAQARGEVSAEHARIIVKTVFALPDQIRAEHGEVVEKELTHHAAQLSPRETAICGQRIHAHLDPDGRAPDEQQKHREFTLHLRPDGTGRATANSPPKLPKNPPPSWTQYPHPNPPSTAPPTPVPPPNAATTPYSPSPALPY